MSLSSLFTVKTTTDRELWLNIVKNADSSMRIVAGDDSQNQIWSRTSMFFFIGHI